MKKLLSLLLPIFIAAALPLNARAYSEEAQSIADTAGANEIESGYLDSEELSGDKTINIFDSTSCAKILQQIFNRHIIVHTRKNYLQFFQNVRTFIILDFQVLINSAERIDNRFAGA